jgi:hypothetical protein
MGRANSKKWKNGKSCDRISVYATSKSHTGIEQAKQTRTDIGAWAHGDSVSPPSSPTLRKRLKVATSQSTVKLDEKSSLVDLLAEKNVGDVVALNLLSRQKIDVSITLGEWEAEA